MSSGFTETGFENWIWKMWVLTRQVWNINNYYKLHYLNCDPVAHNSEQTSGYLGLCFTSFEHFFICFVFFLHIVLLHYVTFFFKSVQWCKLSWKIVIQLWTDLCHQTYLYGEPEFLLHLGIQGRWCTPAAGGRWRWRPVDRPQRSLPGLGACSQSPSRDSRNSHTPFSSL